ncbi:MAG: Uma2 family endonuclease [Isosphaeraceae bacterium]
MTTMTRSKPSKPVAQVRTATPAISDARIVFRGVGWEIYDRLSEAVSEGQHIRMAYDGKDLEIMTTSRVHEHFKDLFGRFVHEVATELKIPRTGGGETTWKRPELLRGLEADQCYEFQAKKRSAVAAALKRRSKNIEDYPNPDHAIEIDISPSQVDRPGIYAALQVPEAWRFDGAEVTVEQLQADGTYLKVKMSQFLPVKDVEIQRWIVEEDARDLTAWCRRLRTWARRLTRRNPRPRQVRRVKGND